MTTPDPETLAFIEALPKTETHLHIEAALPWALLRGTDPERYANPPASWRPDFRFRSFEHFEEELLGYIFAWFDRPERYLEAARMIFAEHLRQNVKYVECSFASGVLEFGGVEGEAVADAIREAVPDGLEVRVFMGIHRNGRTDRSRSFLDACLGWRNLDGLDLHGLETVPLEPWTAELWREARAEGKYTKAHAGEFDGPDSVRRALDELGVRRIEHGTRAAEDPVLVDRLARDDVALDMCPISNVKLAVVPSLAEHPIRRFMRAGVVCTVSTDDPISFGNTLTDEYAALANGLDFTRAELAQVALNGFRVALCEPEVVAPWVAELEGLVAR